MSALFHIFTRVRFSFVHFFFFLIRQCYCFADVAVLVLGLNSLIRSSCTTDYVNPTLT